MNPKRILIIRFSSLGDIILLTPLIREVKKRFPSSQIDFLTSTDFAEICENNPHLHQIFSLDRKSDSKELDRMVNSCKQNNYDLILDAHRSLRSTLFLGKLKGFSVFWKKNLKRIDKRSGKRNLLLLTKINLLKKFPTQREAYCNLLREFIDLNKADLSTELFPGEQHQKRIDRIVQENFLQPPKTIAIGASASFPGKCWPKEYYLELIQKLQERGYDIVLLGGKKDTEVFWLEEQCRVKPINLAGKLSFLESAALLSKCKMAIANDSAIVHFAEAMGTPAISIFGPTVKEFGYGPFLPDSRLVEAPLPCRPCSRNGKGNCKNPIQRECLISTPVDRILQETLSYANKEA